MSGSIEKVTCVLGAQWGDEGKGKLVDILAQQYDVVARFNGGANAGHTLVVEGEKFALHLVPCGILVPNVLNVVGSGTVVHVPTLLEELAHLEKSNIKYEGRLFISKRAHMLFEFHKLIDGAQEQSRGTKKIGTTKRGIGPCYANKMNRNGIRFGDLLHWDSFVQKYTSLVEALKFKYPKTLENYDHESELALYKGTYFPSIQPMISDTILLLNKCVNEGKRVLAEGANAAMLDIDFGTYPAVTSSNTTCGGVATGLGIPPHKLEACVGVVKAYTTRVGNGPFPTELVEGDEVGDLLCSIGHEYGTTTGRRRRCGWLDIPLLQFSNMINGYTSINITKLDVLNTLENVKIGVAYKINEKTLEYGEMPSSLESLSQVQVEYEDHPGWLTDISKCTSFADLPENAISYIRKVEDLLSVPVSWVGVGPDRNQMISVPPRKQQEQKDNAQVNEYIWSADQSCGGCSKAITKIMTKILNGKEAHFDVCLEKKLVTVKGIDRETADLISTKLTKWGVAANKKVEAKFY